MRRMGVSSARARAMATRCHAAGELTRVLRLEALEAHGLEEAQGDLAPARGGDTGELETEADVVEGGPPREQPRVLEDEGDLARRGAGDRRALDEDAARVRSHETADHREQGRLPAAAGAQEGDELPRANCEADGLDGGNRAARRLVALAHALDDDGRAGGHSCLGKLDMLAQRGLRLSWRYANVKRRRPTRSVARPLARAERCTRA